MGYHPKNKTIRVESAIAYLEKEFNYHITPVDFTSLLKLVGHPTSEIEISHRQFDLIRSFIHNWGGYVRG